MKFRNFLAQGFVRTSFRRQSLIPSPRLGVPMETRSQWISGLMGLFMSA